jgi:hypothetical protein
MIPEPQEEATGPSTSADIDELPEEAVRWKGFSPNLNTLSRLFLPQIYQMCGVFDRWAWYSASWAPRRSVCSHKGLRNSIYHYATALSFPPILHTCGRCWTPFLPACACSCIGAGVSPACPDLLFCFCGDSCLEPLQKRRISENDRCLSLTVVLTVACGVFCNH